ncbi:MAG: ankyrin repeat domain-containing protein [Pedosphaera sp.]|nr:ankyrin repeat domain-containing protein [Pedosphaera sp.]
MTALMISIAQNDFETADFLVSVGADVNAKTKKVQDAYGGPEAGWETIIYFDSHHLIYMDDNSRGGDRELPIITKLTRHKNGIDKSVFSADKFGCSCSSMPDMDDGDGGVSKFQTVQLTTVGNKITGWDFTPPSNTAPNPDGGNGGGNETANSRITIKTAGPDIALATDGKLGGAAELQKSNDLRSWRKLVDVPKEASEVLVTPRETGNEFYRLKKK